MVWSMGRGSAFFFFFLVTLSLCEPDETGTVCYGRGISALAV